MTKQLHPLTTQALGYLYDIQSNKPVNPENIQALYNTACDTLPRNVLRGQFMPVMEQIWKSV